jgi:hypothetical protein
LTYVSSRWPLPDPLDPRSGTALADGEARGP